MLKARSEQFSTQLLRQLVARGGSKAFARGEVLIEEGEHSDSLYILLAGELKVYTRADNGRELVYNVMHPGEFFGEMFLDGGPRSASVKAVKPSICVVVGPEQFREFLAAYPEFAEVLVVKLISRVRHATEQLRNVVMKDAYERVAALLNALSVPEGDVRTLDKSVTQQEIADRIGASREMVNHIFRELVRGGYLLKDEDRRLVLAKELPKHW